MEATRIQAISSNRSVMPGPPLRACCLGLMALAFGCGGSENRPPALITTTTSITASPTSVVSGAAVTLTAAVEYAPAETASGTVDFSDNGASLGSASLNPEGLGSLTTTTLAVGTHSLTAAYLGNSTTSASVSAAVGVTVKAKSGVVEATPMRIGVSAVSDTATRLNPQKLAFAVDSKLQGCATGANLEIQRTGQSIWYLTCATPSSNASAYEIVVRDGDQLMAPARDAWFTDQLGREYIVLHAMRSTVQEEPQLAAPTETTP